MYNGLNSPCFNCPDHTGICRSGCDREKAAAARRAEIRDEKNKRAKLESDLTYMAICRVDKIKKSKHLKGA